MPPRSSALGSIVERPQMLSQDLLKSHTCPGLFPVAGLVRCGYQCQPIPSGCRTLLMHDFGSGSLHCMTRIFLELSFTLRLILSNTLPFSFTFHRSHLHHGLRLLFTCPSLPNIFSWHLLIRGSKLTQSLYLLHLSLALNAFGIKLFFHAPFISVIHLDNFLKSASHFT